MNNQIVYKPADRWKRLISYILDVIPFVILVYLFVYYYIPSYRRAFDDYFASPREDLGVYEEFLKHRNHVRNFSLLMWSLYSLFMDAMPSQGTIAKRLLGLQVIDSKGERLTIRKAAVRNFAKLVGTLPLCLGMFWVFFDKYKRPLHDKVSGTFVVEIDDNVRLKSSSLNDYIQHNKQLST